jgi:hypothetical protein
MASWCDNAKLVVNASKSQCLHFHLPQTIIESSLLIKLRDKNIQTSTESKFLGIVINDTLNWTSHTEHIMKKLASAPYLLRHLRKIASEPSVMAAYYAYVYSHLSYGVIFWGVTQQAARIFKQQKRIIRALAGLSYRATCRPIFINKRLLTLHGIFIYQTIMYATTNDTLSTTSTTDHRVTRNRKHYTLPSHKTRMYKNSPLYLGQVFFNSLPQAMKDQCGTSRFKKSLKDYLCQLCPYSINEFYAPAP